MPAPSDILQFMRGQLFETTKLPHTNFAGKTIVITGANTGLGFECAKQVAQLRAATIVLGCRNVTAGEEAKRRILSSCKTDKPPSIHVWHIDMKEYDSVKSFAAKMQKELARCDSLIANAGISTNEFSLAEDFESTLTVNVVSTFLLSMLALPLLGKTASELDTMTHLTIVGSNVHCFADHAQLETTPTGQVFSMLSQAGEADMAARYFLSKLMVMQCTRELAVAATDPTNSKSISQVVINCPSPGWCKTELFRQDDGGFWGRNMLRLIGRTAEEGGRALTSAIAAGGDSHGQYLSECRVKPASVYVRSENGQRVQKKVWSELLGIIETISPEAVRALH